MWRAVLIFAGLLSLTYSFKILCIFSVPSRSHDNLGKGVVDTLLDAGHEVTWVTSYGDKKPQPRLTVIPVPETLKILEGMNMTGDSKKISIVIEFARNITIATAKNSQVKLVLEKEHFDAIIVEWFMSDANAGYAAVQQVPSIMMNGFPMTPYMETVVDEFKSPAIVPAVFSELPIPMNLWQRMQNTYLSLSMVIGNWLLDYPTKSSVYEELFSPIAKSRGTELPPLLTALYNTSIYLINSHPSISPALSLPPNVVEIGGYHIEESVPPLPKDLKEIMDSSSQGVIYFSMGSVLNPATFPENTIKELIQVLGELPVTVLWKYNEKLEGLPRNVHIRPWMPQNSILAHPNVVLFITHGGLLSTTEAVHFGVPVLCVPVFGDQPANAARVRQAGLARTVSFSPDMAREIKEQAMIMLRDQSYKEKAKELSAIFRNRPVPPRKLIAHYVELAIKSKGAYHLRSKSHLYAWYERWMLDQIMITLSPVITFYIIIKKIVASKFGAKTKTVKTKSRAKMD